MKKVTKLGALLFGLVLAGSCVTGCSSDKVSAEEALKEAGGYVWSMYYNHDVTTKSNSFDVITHTLYEGCDVQIDWNLSVTKGIQTGAIEYKETADTNTDTIYVGYYDGKVTEETEYQLVPTFSYDGKTMTLAEIVGEEKAVFKYKTPVFKLNNHTEWLAEGSSGKKTLNIKGVVLDVIGGTSSSAGSFYFQDAEGFGYYAYLPATKDAVKAGDVVVVTGKRSDYSGQQEFAKGCTFHIYEGQTQDVKVNNGTADWKSWENSSKYTDLYHNNYVELNNCVATRVDGSYYYFKVDGGKAEYNVYDSYYFLTDAQRDEFKATWAALQATNTPFTVQGISTVYSNKIQVYGSTKLPTIFKGVEMNDKQKAIVTLTEGTAQFAESYAKDTEIELAAKGTTYTDATLTYAVVEPASSELVKIEEGKLKIKIDPSYSQVKVKVTAKLGAETIEETVTIKTALTYTTLADVLKNKDMTNVQYVHGYVVAANGDHETAGSFVLDDGTATMFSYKQLKVALGDEVTLSTVYAENNGLPQLGSKSLINVISSNNPYTGKISGEITKDNIATIKDALKQTNEVYDDAEKAAKATEDYFGHIVKATGYLVKKGDYINLYATNGTDTQVCQLYLDPLKDSVTSLLGTEVDVYGFARTFYSGGITLQAQAIVAKDTEYAVKATPSPLLGCSLDGIKGNDLTIDTSISGYNGTIYNFQKDTKITNAKDFGEIDHVEVVIVSTYANNLPQVKAAAKADGLKSATKLGDYSVTGSNYTEGHAPVKVADVGTKVSSGKTYKAAQYTFTYTPAAGCHYFEISAETTFAFQVSAINVYYK